MKSKIGILCVCLALCCFSQTNIAQHAIEAYNYMLSECMLSGPTVDNYWKNPVGEFARHENGWMGGQAIQSIILNYERTGDEKFRNQIRSFSSWLRYTFILKDALSSCGTSDPAFTVNNWSDDAGWTINMYFQFYKYTGDQFYLNLAYQTLLNSDIEWGEDFGANARALRYQSDGNPAANNLTMYMVSHIIGALEIYSRYKNYDNVKANKCIELASKYYNFIENKLRSNGLSPFHVPNNFYEHQINIVTLALSDNDPDQYPGFTFAQMGMACVHEIFFKLQSTGTDFSQWIISTRRANFHNNAIAIANVVVALQPYGFSETSSQGNVLINARDPNVNGFALNWWVKYIANLNNSYRDIIINTAERIIDNNVNNSNVIVSSMGTCWNSAVAGSGAKCSGSQSCNYGGTYFEFVKHASATTILAAAAYLESNKSLPSWDFWIVKDGEMNQRRILSAIDD